MKIRIIHLLAFVAFLVMPLNISAQDWRKLVPLVSKCSDVKRILKVEKCTFPVSDYELSPRLAVNINFTKKENQRWEQATVRNVLISFRGKYVRLDEFETDLSGYEILPDGDLLMSRIYRNEKKGISFYVEEFDGKRYFGGAELFPKKVRIKTKGKR